MRPTGLILLTALLASAPAAAQQDPAGLARPGTAKVTDAVRLLAPGDVHLRGLLGERVARSERNRLLHVDEDELLDGFRHRPGKHPWIGEHAGKWLHAACLEYAYTRDPLLKAKIGRIASGLVAAQEPDGYLGTYEPAKRFGLYPGADWDVWSHKYCLIGLLAAYQFTGDQAALGAARRIGDLLIATFGPGRKSINAAGTHLGMAATSVLEPVMLLYRATGDARYLDFARYIVGAWEQPDGPHIISSLLRYRTVRRVANAKAYEMLSNLNGLCELYRATGDRQYLRPVLIAWQDVARNRLYITGSGSAGECWQDDFVLPNGEGASICETCVTVTWEQLNLQLFRLLGEARFADELERTVYNHLLGAQKPTGESWCYYTPLQGRKPYSAATTCCLSSGPRGVALIPTFAYAAAADGIDVDLYGPSEADVALPGAGRVRLAQETVYPLDGAVRLTVSPVGGPRRFALRLRVPAWASGMRVTVAGRPVSAAPRDGWLTVVRTWRAGDRVDVRLPVSARLVLGDHGNAGRAAVEWGPLVLAADGAHSPGALVSRLLLPADAPGRLRVARVGGGVEDPVFAVTVPGRAPFRLTPFYAAGQDGSPVCVWLRRPGQAAAPDASLLLDGEETRSRAGNQPGAANDGDRRSFCVTFDGTRQAEDWYAVTLAAPVVVGRVVFAHGRSFHDGGWFDTSAGKPRVQVQADRGGPWLDVAVLDTYPATTASVAPGLAEGQAFAVTFPPRRVWGVRVVGIPSCGDSPAQAFSSCGELEAFPR